MQEGQDVRGKALLAAVSALGLALGVTAAKAEPPPASPWGGAPPSGNTGDASNTETGNKAAASGWNSSTDEGCSSYMCGGGPKTSASNASTQGKTSSQIKTSNQLKNNQLKANQLKSNQQKLNGMEGGEIPKGATGMEGGEMPKGPGA